jgi:hypothetical protein
MIKYVVRPIIIVLERVKKRLFNLFFQLRRMRFERYSLNLIVLAHVRSIPPFIASLSHVLVNIISVCLLPLSLANCLTQKIPIRLVENQYTFS